MFNLSKCPGKKIQYISLAICLFFLLQSIIEICRLCFNLIQLVFSSASYRYLYHYWPNIKSKASKSRWLRNTVLIFIIRKQLHKFGQQTFFQYLQIILTCDIALLIVFVFFKTDLKNNLFQIFILQSLFSLKSKLKSCGIVCVAFGDTFQNTRPSKLK